MAKGQAEEVAPRRSTRQREKRKISDEALVAEEAKPKQAKKAETKKQPKREKELIAETEKPQERKNEEDSPLEFGPETQEMPGSQESFPSEGLPLPDLPLDDLYPKSSQEQTDSDEEIGEKTATAKVEPTGMFKIATWNVAGLYAAIKKDFCKSIKTLDIDVICLQETKLSLKKPPPPEIAEQLKEWKYRTYANSEGKAGYSGTAILSKTKPLSVQRGIGKAKHDDFGRSCTAEFPKFFLVTSYVPNSGRGLVNLDYRTNEWESDLRKYLTKLNKDKPVIYCGDLNVAHTAIDLKNDKSNYNKTAGYTQAEIDELEKLLGLGYVDAYRKLYPAEEDCYTFWSYMGGARAKNVGWRLDYFLMSKDCEDWVEDVVIHSKVQGSDHCPVEIKLNLP